MRAVYVDLDKIWNGRAAMLNARLRGGGAAGAGREPVVDLDDPLYAAVALQLDASVLRAREGLALSWIGTGRLIFSLNYTDADFAAVADRFVAAANADAARRLVVARSRHHQQVDPARPAERDAGSSLLSAAAPIHRQSMPPIKRAGDWRVLGIDQFTAHQVAAAPCSRA